jgi:phosphoribosylanthranilate isomerase
VTEEQAREIRQALSSTVCSLVGVFVNETFTGLMKKVERCGLDAVQLHGKESPQLVLQLVNEGVRVIKGLFVNAEPSLEAAPQYKAAAFLAECAGGPLPGGNAMTWNWDAALRISESHPLILAGGLNPDNVCDAIKAARPDAVDVSSGVEAKPGRKDMEKVKRFMEAVARSGYSHEPRRIFV